MGCLCYVIGGPFIAEDPDCPQHGFQAQRDAEEREQERRQQEEEDTDRDERLEALEETVELLQKQMLAITQGLGWTKVSDKAPVPGLIVKRFKSGSVWAGYYSGTDKESSFVEYIQLPP